METKSNGFRTFLGSTLGRWVMTVVFAVAIWGLMYLFLFLQAVIGEVGLFLALPLAIFVTIMGWKTLSRITPEIFVFMPLGGWLIYFVVKFILSVFVGYFTVPIYLGKKISEKVQQRIAEQEANEMEQRYVRPNVVEEQYAEIAREIIEETTCACGHVNDSNSNFCNKCGLKKRARQHRNIK